MAWPSRPEIWPDVDATQRDYAAVAHGIRRFEPLTMLARPEHADGARSMLGADIDVLEMLIDDSWTRDSGPNFLVNQRGQLAGTDYRFNAWGEKYEPHDQDALMAQRILEHVGAERLPSELIVEGGALTVDGEGTLITTESCLLNKNRNPIWSRAEIEAELIWGLGVSKVIWLPGDKTEIETDGHVDGLAAFVRPGVVLMESPSGPPGTRDKILNANIERLRGQTDAAGREFEIHFIPEARGAGTHGERFCLSYINAYLANGAVITPCYGIDADSEVKEIFQDAFPDREVVQIRIDHIAVGGGGIHCITQQQPKVSA
jgi:agmatine deiminase